MQQRRIVPDNNVAATVFRAAAKAHAAASFLPSVSTPISVVIWRIAIDMQGQLDGR
jgi:hypothetical protein